MPSRDRALLPAAFLAAELLAGAAAPFVAPAALAAPPCAILVSTLGTDVPGCGGEPGSPCRTIAYGISRAQSDGVACVFIRVGTYNEIVVPPAGINLVGGFGSNWVPGPYTDPAHQVRIIGARDTGPGGEGQFLTVRAHSLGTGALISNLILQAPDATLQGYGSYVVHASFAQLALENVRLECGAGAAGPSGAAGADATSLVPAASGSAGGNGREYTTACDASGRGGGGSAGTNTCSSSPSTRLMNGGAGGAGGTMDTDCACCSFDYDARAGLAGSNAAYTSGPAGTLGTGGPANVAGCTSGGGTPGGAGNPGAFSNGMAGTGGSGGSLVGGYWSGASGTAGGTGENGGGGGGGGGAGGCDEGTDAYGAGGGGGGAGGCAARGGGVSGGGGGASVGVLAVLGSAVTMTNCEVVRGSGGVGGAGGSGGRGQPGGLGGPAGTAEGTSLAGAGGKGAHGGHGGGAGGGAGGISYAIVRTSGSTVGTSGLSVFGGSGGAGGPGGVSAPGAPPADADGSDGGAGSAGAFGLERVVTGSEASEVAALAGRGGTLRGAALSGSAGCDVNCVLVGVDESSGAELSFAGVMPNPVTSSSRIMLTLPREARVRIELFDIGGRRIAVMCDRVLGAGAQGLSWREGLAGRELAAGVYRVRAGVLGREFVRSVVVVR